LDNIRVFTKIYEEGYWGSNGKSHASYTGSSGPGSSISYNIDSYIPFVRKFIRENKISKVVDLGHGDWQSSHLIYDGLDVSYVGYDAYEKICRYNSKKYPAYTFIYCDFVKDIALVEKGDLFIIKDVLQHLCNRDIVDTLSYLINNKRFKYILITNCCEQEIDDEDIVNGGWRQLSVLKSPLSIFKPVILLKYHTKEVSLIRS